MKIRLGGEFDLSTRNKVEWIRSNFSEDKYKIIDEGFLMNDYYVEFVEEKYATLFGLRWPKQ
jgi:hypothetical protein